MLIVWTWIMIVSTIECPGLVPVLVVPGALHQKTKNSGPFGRPVLAVPYAVGGTSMSETGSIGTKLKPRHGPGLTA